MFGVTFVFENTFLKHVSFFALFLAVSAAIFLFFLHILLSMKSDK